LALLAAIAGPALAGQGSVPAASGTAKKSPPLTVRTTDGRVIEIHKQAGKVVLVDFMTTTCPTCKRASEGIQRLYQEFGGKGFLAIALALGPRDANVVSIYKGVYGLTFPVGAITREDVLKYLDHPANEPMMVPTLVLLDKRGRISKMQVGWTDEQELRSVIARLLNEKM
jgi:peroxiredoxin